MFRHQRTLESSENAEKLLQQFVENGFGEWVDLGSSSHGGKPTRGFKSSVHGDNPINSTVKQGLSPQPTEEAAVFGETWSDYISESEVEL